MIVRTNVLRDHIRAELYLDYGYPLYMAEEEQEKKSLKRVNGITYWDAQVRVIKALARLGIIYRMNERIEPMKVMAFFDRFWRSQAAADSSARDAVTEAEDALSELVKMRTLGIEPPHNKTHYG